MSHKRPSKRSRSSVGEIPGYSSPFNEYLTPKRSKREEPELEETSSSVRRSSRAPKPKVFDDEYIDTLRSSLDENEVRGKKDKVLSPKEPDRQTFDDRNFHDSDSIRRSSRVPKPKLFDEDYVESSKSKLELKSNESVKKNEEEPVPFVVDFGIKQRVQKTKEERKEKRKSRSSSEVMISHPVTSDKHNTPKGTQKARKPSSSKKDSKLYSSTDLMQESPKSRIDDHYRGDEDSGGSSKVRQSSRTPIPKKTFALIEDTSFLSKQGDGLSEEEFPVEIDVEEDIDTTTTKTPNKSNKKHSLKPILSVCHSDSSKSTSSIDVLQVSSEHGKKKGKAKPESSSEEKPKKKSKKVKSDSAATSKTLARDAMEISVVKIPVKEGRKDSKDKSKKNSIKSTKEAVAKGNEKKLSEEGKLIASREKVQAKNNKKKSKKNVVEKGELSAKALSVVQSPPTIKEKGHCSNTHGKKTHKHSVTKHDVPHSETKDEDQHIILKLHLPHSEGSSHIHSHKKHKHKHHTSDSKTESLPSEGNKSKKRKLSLMEGSASTTCTSEDTHKKKVSIKFKGLSSNKPGVEVDVNRVESPLPSSSVAKNVKRPETKKKKSKKPSPDVTPPPAIPSEEQDHLKMTIKKNKKEIKVAESTNEKVPDKTRIKESKSKPKEAKVVNKRDTEAKPRTSAKKKGKAGGTSGKNPNVKEKRKNITGYLLFCKKERSHIVEANPGLEFAQISQKVGEIWNNLLEKDKQKWRDKANDIKAQLNPNKKEEKKQEVVNNCPDVVDMAAHLKLLGESLTLIGVSLMAQRETEVHGSLSVLLDSILCAICPLTFLTSYIPEIPGIAKEKQDLILDNLAYTMPGLG